jgi:CrcB protein
MSFVAVFVGGVVGTLARAGLLAAVPTGTGWPWATWLANLVGAALLASTSVRRSRLLSTGFCGALTTFSTFQLEALHMLDRGQAVLAVAYVASSVAAGLLLVSLVRRSPWA